MMEMVLEVVQAVLAMDVNRAAAAELKEVVLAVKLAGRKGVVDEV